MVYMLLCNLSFDLVPTTRKALVILKMKTHAGLLHNKTYRLLYSTVKSQQYSCVSTKNQTSDVCAAASRSNAKFDCSV